jgi:hypothetical protein
MTKIKFVVALALLEVGFRKQREQPDLKTGSLVAASVATPEQRSD